MGPVYGQKHRGTGRHGFGGQTVKTCVALQGAQEKIKECSKEVSAYQAAKTFAVFFFRQQ